MYNEMFVLPSTLGTGEKCLLTGGEWMKLRIRAGSEYWSKGGTEHTPVLISRPKLTKHTHGVVGLKVEPDFAFGPKVAKVKLPEGCRYFYWRSALSATWDAFKTKRMFDEFIIEKWTPVSRTKNSCGVEEVESEGRCKKLASTYNKIL